MATRKIDLNKFELVSSEDEILEGQTGIIILPLRLKDGTQPPALHFRKGLPKQTQVKDVTDVCWTQDTHISKDGTDHEYARRVDWWFDEAMKDEEYKETINETYNRNGYQLKVAWEKARNWLKSRVPSARKTNIHKFVWTWLNKGMLQQLGRLEKQRTGQWR